MKRVVRNVELALVLKRDPARLRSRTVEPEQRKLKHKRARRKAVWRRDRDQDDG